MTITEPATAETIAWLTLACADPESAEYERLPHLAFKHALPDPSGRMWLAGTDSRRIHAARTDLTEPGCYRHGRQGLQPVEHGSEDATYQSWAAIVAGLLFAEPATPVTTVEITQQTVDLAIGSGIDPLLHFTARNTVALSGPPHTPLGRIDPSITVPPEAPADHQVNIYWRQLCQAVGGLDLPLTLTYGHQATSVSARSADGTRRVLLATADARTSDTYDAHGVEKS